MEMVVLPGAAGGHKGCAGFGLSQLEAVLALMPGHLCSGRGVGFSFIFSWLLMLLVLITFVLGGNTYMIVCESWRSQQLFQVSSPWGDAPVWSHRCLSKGCW